jgi:glycine oxidase
VSSSAIQGSDVAIVGAGLIGLAIARELALRGATVRVYDRGQPGGAASWAGAGMLAPHTEAIEDAAMRALCAQSLAAYPAFSDAVAAESGVDPHLRLNGIVSGAYDEASEVRLGERAAAFRAGGIDHQLLDRPAALSLEPALGKRVRSALLVRGEGTVDNRRLGRALTAAAKGLGVIIVSDARDVAIECDERRVLGVRSHRGFAAASWVVNAAGAWAAQIAGVPAGAVAPVTPIKGQMLALAAPRGFLKRPLWVPGAYLVPRDDGRLLIGATVENVGFDVRVTAEGVRRLLDAALEAAPALRDFAVTETWAGLRPGTPDGRPLIGPTSIDGLLLATGHYRNGILLAPVTAQLIADVAEEKERAGRTSVA